MKIVKKTRMSPVASFGLLFLALIIFFRFHDPVVAALAIGLAIERALIGEVINQLIAQRDHFEQEVISLHVQAAVDD